MTVRLVISQYGISVYLLRSAFHKVNILAAWTLRPAIEGLAEIGNFVTFIPMNPLVSILMAVKDTEPYLPDCLDSILAQTYPHWELIAVNDHSSDRSPEILQQYAAQDTRIRVFHSDRPSLIPALQVAYRQSRGPLINRMDSDDKMPADKLQGLVDAWQPHGRGTVIAGGTEHFVDEGEVGDGFRRYERWLNQVARRSSHYEEIYQECVIPSHSWLIHRDDLDAVGAFNPEVYPEDYDLCFRFYRQRLRVVGLDKVLHYWRDRSDRISRTWECYRDNRYFDAEATLLLRTGPRPVAPAGAVGRGAQRQRPGKAFTGARRAVALGM